MKFKLFIGLILLVGGLKAQTVPCVTPQNIIIDTDIGTDIDDAHAIAIALRLRQLNCVNILAITVSTWQDKAPAFVNLMLAHGNLTTTDIPIGAYQGASPAAFACTNDGTDLYPDFVLNYFLTNSITPNVPNVGRASFPAALGVLRKALATAADHSVKLVVLGGHTNIAALMQSAANTGGDGYADGMTLFNNKLIEVDPQLSGFSSSFPYTASPIVQAPPGAYNAGCDLTAAKYVFEHNGSIPIKSSPLQDTMPTGGCYDGSGPGCTASLPNNSPVRWASDHFKNVNVPGRYTVGLSNSTTSYGAPGWDPAAFFFSVVGTTTPTGSLGPYYSLSANGSMSFVLSPAQSTWTVATSLNHFFSINSTNWIKQRDLEDTLFMADYVSTARTFTISPLTTPAAAYTILETTAVCGDTIQFTPGTWDVGGGNLFRASINDRVCTAGNELKIKAQDPTNRPVFNLRYAPVNLLPGDYANSDLDRGFIMLQRCSYIIVDGLKIIAAASTSTSNTAGLRLVFSNHITVKNNYFQQNFNGIFATSTNSIFEYNEFRGNGYYGNDQSHQFYESGGDNVTVRYNTFLGNGTGLSDTCCLLEDGTFWATGGGQNLHIRSWNSHIYGNWFQDGRDYEWDMATPGNCPTLSLAPVGWCTNPGDLTQHMYFYNNTVIAGLNPENTTKITVIQNQDGIGWNPSSPFTGFTGGHQVMHLFTNTFIGQHIYGDYTGGDMGYNSPPNNSCCQYSLVEFNNDPLFATQALEYSNNILHFTQTSGYAKSLFLVHLTGPWAVTGQNNWFNSNNIGTCDTPFSGANGTCSLTGTVKGVAVAGAAPFNSVSTFDLTPTALNAFGIGDVTISPQSAFSATAPNTYIARSAFTERGALQYIIPPDAPPPIFKIPDVRIGGITITIGITVHQ